MRILTFLALLLTMATCGFALQTYNFCRSFGTDRYKCIDCCKILSMVPDADEFEKDNECVCFDRKLEVYLEKIGRRKWRDSERRALTLD